MDLELGLEVLGPGLVEPTEEGVSGAGDEHLDIAEFGAGAVDEARHRVRVGHVQRQRHRLTATGADSGGKFLAPVHPAGAQGHRETPRGEFGGGGRADTR